MKLQQCLASATLAVILATSAKAQYFVGSNLGGPTYPGSVVTNVDSSLTISGGGDDIWNNGDNCYYYYAWASGTQWVATVLLTDLQGPDNWTKAELMVRKSNPTVGPKGTDAFIAAMSTRAGGQNEIADQFRSTDSNGADWVELGPVWRPTYPNQWMRLSRTNSSFTVAFSGDGANFTNYLAIDTASSALVGGSTFGQAWPNTVTVGLAVVAHNDGSTDLGIANFKNLSVTFPPVTAPTVVGASTQVHDVTTYAGSEASFTFVTTNNASPPVVNWPAYVSYQWSKNGTPIANATSTSYTHLVNPLDATENNALYSCQATILPPYNTSVSGLNSSTGKVTVLPGAVYYTNGLKQELFAGATSRKDVENGNVAAASAITKISIMDNPGGLGANYVTRNSGWFIPPSSDYYVFFVACDDDSDLFLSTDNNPANKRLIAQEGAWSGTDSWLNTGSGDPTLKRSDQWSPDGGATFPYSGGIQLTAGTPYYIELVHHNGTGGDNFAVTFQTTNQVADPNWPNVFTNGLPSQMTNDIVLLTSPTTSLVWSLQPTNTSVSQGSSATLFARATTDSELTPLYQWYHNGLLVPGATQSSISTGLTTPANNGDTYYVVSTTEEGGFSITSSVSTITVISAILERGWAGIEFWQGATRGSIESGAAGAPTYTTTSPGFEASVNNETGSSYGRRVTGFFIPPTTGDYVFFVNSDDDSDLFISTDDTPAHKYMIAQETAWSNPLQWTGDTGGTGGNPSKRSDSWQGTNTSPPYASGIHLLAGTHYYLEADQTEGGGGDNIEVTYKLIAESDPWLGMDTKLRGSVLSSFAPRCTYVAFSTQPTNVTVAPSLSGSVSFYASGTTDSRTPVGITGDVRPLVGNWSYVMYQWQKNGVDLPGATSSNLQLVGPILPSDSGTVFTCRMRALGFADNSLTPIWSNSLPATLTVTPNIPLTFEPGLVLVEHWDNKVRSDIETGIAGNPVWVSTSPEFAVSTNNGSGDNYARRIAGYFIPPTTDNYVFWITADDDADLFLGTDSSPLSKRLIARDDNWADPFHWLSGNGTLSNKRSDQFSDWATGLNNGFSAGIHLIAGTKYYLEAVHHEGGGGDNLEVTYSLASGPTPNDLDDTLMKNAVIGMQAPASHVAITNQPHGVTTPNYQSVTFTLGASTDSQISFGNPGDIRTGIGNFIKYQWYKNGTPISGASASSYTLPAALPSDNGAQFYCSIRSVGLGDGLGNAVSSNSLPATLNVTTNAPHLLYAAVYTNNNFVPFTGSSTTMVTLYFDSPMDPALLSQLSTYTIGSGLSIVGITINSNDFRSVILAVTGTPTLPFSITLNSNVSGLGGGLHVVNPTLGVSGVQLANQDIGTPGGDPSLPGVMVPNGTNSYTIFCEGSDIYNSADGFNFTYESKTNDFDVVVRQKDTRHTSNWSKGGLMIRETLDAGSRNWNIVNDPLASDGIMAPDGSGFGANAVEANARVSVNGGSGGWNFTGGGAPTYPNAWVRMTRRGQVLSAYHSSDGNHWTLMATNDVTLVGDTTPLPAAVFVGMCTTAHNNDPVGTPVDQLQYLQIVDYADYNSSYTPPSTLSVSVSGGNLVISWNPTVGHLQTSPALGTAADWQNVTGGTVSPVILPIGAGAHFFRVVNP